MEFISRGNIFQKLLNKPMQRKSDFGGQEYFILFYIFSKIPPPKKVPSSILFLYCQGYETNIYNPNMCISL